MVTQINQLTQEEELQIFVSIENSEKKIWSLFSRLPPTLIALLTIYNQYKNNSIKIHQIVRTVSFEDTFDEGTQKKQIDTIFTDLTRYIVQYIDLYKNEGYSEIEQKNFTENFTKKILELKPNKKIIYNIYKIIKSDYKKIIVDIKILSGILKELNVSEKSILEGKYTEVDTKEVFEEKRKEYLDHYNSLHKILEKYTVSIWELKDSVLELAKLIKDIEAGKEKIFKANLYLVSIFVSKYNSNPNTAADFFQEGSIGLLAAIDKFEYQRGIKFSTYANWWIRQHVSRSALDRMIHVPSHIFETAYKIQKNIRKTDLQTGSPADIGEISEMVSKSPEKVLKVLQYANSETVSLDEKISETSNTHFTEYLKDESLSDIEDDIDTKTIQNEIGKILRILSSREKHILIRRYGLDGKDCATLEEVGEELGLTRERIRQLEAIALKKLKHPVYSYFLSSFFSEKFEKNFL